MAKNELKYVSLFSGVGSPEMALERLGIKVNLVGFSEIDKYAIGSYCEIHDVSKELNLGDITKIDISKLPKNIDLITHGSPCQSFSVAGKGEGGDEGSGTRSSLMWNTVEIVKHCTPKYVLWENVKNVISKKHIHNFEKYIDRMNELGYNNYYRVLNSKDYEIPQNRDRLFVISIRQDIDTKEFVFPEKIGLKLSIKDMLEDVVDDKYYVSHDKVELFFKQGNVNPSGRGMNGAVNTKDLANTITTNKGEGQKILIKCNEGVLDNSPKNKIIKTDIPQIVRVRKYEVDTDKLKETLRERKAATKKTISDITSEMGVTRTTVEHWFRTDNCFSIPDAEVWLKLKEVLNITTDYFDKSIMEFEEKLGSFEKANRCYHTNGIAPTITTLCQNEKILENTGEFTSFRIRKLTPRECWRLMGFSDEDFEKAERVSSNTQLYKQAGNSIVVNVLEHIFKNLLKEYI